MIDLGCLKVYKELQIRIPMYSSSSWDHVLKNIKDANVLYSVSFDPVTDTVGFSYHGKYMFSSANPYIKKPHVKLLRFLYEFGIEDLCDGVKFYIMGSESIRAQYRDGYMLQVRAGMKDKINTVDQSDKDFISTIVLSGNS